MIFKTTDETNDKIIDAKTKLNKWESIWAPSTNLKAKYKTKALITKENKPNVKIVIGKAKNLSTGSTTL